MNKKIFRSIWLTALIVMASSVLIIMGSLYAYFSNIQRSQLKIETMLAAQGVEMNGLTYLKDLDAEDYRITWISADGTVLYDNEADSAQMENHLERKEVKEALESGYGESTRYSSTISHRQFYAAVLLKDGTVLRLSSAQRSIWSLLLGFMQPICIVVLIALAITFILAFRLSKKIVEPINSIDPDQPMKYIGQEGYVEVEPLLRKMRSQQIQIRKDQEKLEHSSLIRQEFTANVSHELKTPLHSISGYAELIESGLAKEEDIKPFAARIRQESGRLSSLVEDIIELTKLDSGAKDVKWESVDVYEMAANVIDTLEDSAAKKHVSLELKGENAWIQGAPGVVHGIIYNLCDNAIKYNIEGGRVTVLADDRDDRVRLSVSDTGIGIPEEDRERVFERFYRVDKSHSREMGGTGLGLSIVKHGAMVHHADIRLESEPGKGSVFTVIFPKFHHPETE